MKKILAVLLSLVMAFSLAVPAMAAIEDEIDNVHSSVGNISDDASDAIDAATGVYDSIVAEDYEAAINGAFDFAVKLAKAIHTLVHTLSEMFDFDCPFCDGTMADDDAADEDTTVAEEETTEVPTTEEPTTEVPTTEEPTTEVPTTEEPTTEEPTTEEPTTEEPTTEEPTTEEPTTEEPTTEEPTTEEPTTEEPTTEEPTTQPEVSYETYSVRVANSTIASDRNYNYTSNGAYPMNVDIAIYMWNRTYKANTVTIMNMATAYVNAGVYISSESVGVDTIVFAGGNNFHSNGGIFKLIVNDTETPVKVRLSGTNKIGSTVLTAANVGDYIVGPYTIVD